MVAELIPSKRALVVAPHPDDAELGCGGTVARLIREGTDVYYIIATNGDKGTEDPKMTSRQLAETREAEQREAAALLGVKEVLVLQHGDGELEDNRVFLEEMTYHIRRIRPDIVFTNDPFRSTFYIHRDHRITGMITMDAVFPFSRDRLHFPRHYEQGLLPHKTEEIYFWGTENPNVFVDISEAFDLKLQAIRAHASQFDLDQIDKWVTRMAKNMGKQGGHPYAEAFRRYGISEMSRRRNGEEED